jgi:hypothetical protein
MNRAMTLHAMLAWVRNHFGLLFFGLTLVAAPAGFSLLAPVQAATALPAFKIVSVVPDQSVTIQTTNFPTNLNFQVRMGAMGTQGVNGTLVTTHSSGAGGSQTFEYAIPSQLQGARQIAIRLESTTGDHHSYNWFYNSSATAPGGSSGGTGGAQPPAVQHPGAPVFRITSVVRNGTVTVQASNFPPNSEFRVLMNSMGTQGINGAEVATKVNSGNGSFTGTYTIPAHLHNARQIAIRFEGTPFHNLVNPFFSYNWFYNNTTN